MKNIRIFYLKNCHFLVVKFSLYLNRRVFVMVSFTSMKVVYPSHTKEMKGFGGGVHEFV